MYSPSLSSREEKSLSPHNTPYYFGPSRLLTKRIRVKSYDGTLDFTINDGNHIHIASVVWASQAYAQGLRPGDQIISVNGITFDRNINYTQALQILYATSELDMIIRTLRVNALDATLYDWYDPIQQRSTSPPPGTYLSVDAQLPYFERTVKVVVEKGKRLGLVIRGGVEYGLGVFISGVDKGSLSDQCGLSIGDQILSVNQTDFRHITHKDAVALLRNNDNMSIHLRQINKLPKPRNEIKRIVNKTSETTTSSTTTSSSQLIEPIRNINKSSRDLSYSKRKFFQEILNDEDRSKLKNSLKNYSEYQIHIDYLIKILLHILNKQYQQNRNQIIESIRKFIRPNDIDRFDIYILKDDLNTLKLSHERFVQHSLSPSRVSFNSPKNNMSKSVENLRIEDEERLIRPKSLIFDEHNPMKRLSIPIERKFSNENSISPINNLNNNFHPLRKTKSLVNVDQNNYFLPINKFRDNLTIEQNYTIDNFLKDYSSPYPITIHKVRPTLGVAVEGGFQDRIPLPRIVYMQPDGSAYVSSGLRVGHVVVGLNGYLMKGLSHREAALFIASSFKDKNSSRMDLLVAEPLIDQQQ